MKTIQSQFFNKLKSHFTVPEEAQQIQLIENTRNVLSTFLN